MKNIDPRKQNYEQMEPRHIPRDYYDFSFYVSKVRMITYWHQANEILAKKPDKILEVGIGNGIVTNIIKAYDIDTTTADINELLNPDKVVSITELSKSFEKGEYPFVLCARVLQHLPFSEFDKALSQLRHVTSKHLLLTLPVETLRLYFQFRITGRKSIALSIPFPLIAKRLLQFVFRLDDNSKAQNFWKINQKSEVSMTNIREVIQNYFNIEKAYQVPEDMSHAFFVLTKKMDSKNKD